MSANIYPLPGFHFAVAFIGLLPTAAIDTMWQEVSGLSAEMSVEELTQGGENDAVYKLPLRTRYPNLVLKRGLTPVPSALGRWAEEAVYDFSFKPCQVQVVLLNEQHIPVSGWSFKGAYAVKVGVSDFNAMNNSLVIETLELTYRKVDRLSTNSISIPGIF